MAYAYTHEERWNRARIGSTSSFAYTGTSARTASDLAFGFYRIVCTTDAHILQGDSTVTATTSDYPLYIGQEAFAMVDAGLATAAGAINNDSAESDNIAAIRQSANGTCYVTQIDEN